MVWKIIMMIFMQKQSGPAMEQLVQKLSETPLIRSAARLTAYHFLRNKDKFLSLKDSRSVTELRKKALDFKKDIENEINKSKDNFKK